jgi:hypothetical protein
VQDAGSWISGHAAPGVAGQTAAGGPHATVADQGQLRVRIEDIQHVTLQIVTVACAGECVDIEAVALGGNPPYTFEWEDGSQSPRRHVCTDAAAALIVRATDTPLTTPEFRYEAQTISSTVAKRVLPCPDAGALDAGDCAAAEDVMGDITGEVRYFNQGASVPAGRYRVAYTGGCMKFGPPVNWTVHNFLAISWSLIGETNTLSIAALPGPVGVGYVNFDECVAAGLAIAPIEIEHTGGKLGVWLSDAPYTDNVPGEKGNPTWRLIPLAGCQ